MNAPMRSETEIFPREGTSRPLRVAHLPFYDDNPYQTLLINSLRDHGVEAFTGGGGGNFFRSALYRWRADILHFHWLHPYLLRNGTGGTMLRGGRLLAEIAALKARGIRIVWTVHNLANHEGRQSGWERRFTRVFLRLCDQIICHGEVARDALCAMYPPADRNRVRIIPHGHYIEQYPNSVSAKAARVALGIAHQATVFLFLGRIQPYKGVEELLEAFRAVSEREAVLVIAGGVGNEHLHAQLQAAADADRRIRFHPGRVANDRLQNYFNAADAVVLPFRTVLTSGSAILAMSFGRACVAPAVGCLPEHLGDGNLFFRTADVPDLSAALRLATRDRAKLSDVGAANRRRAGQWSWQRIAQDTVELYKSLCQAPGLEARGER